MAHYAMLRTQQGMLSSAKKMLMDIEKTLRDDEDTNNVERCKQMLNNFLKNEQMLIFFVCDEGRC